MDEYISTENRLPEDGEKIQMKHKCDEEEIRVCRGFFYQNSGFVSFGKQITDVVSWKHCNSNMGFN